MALSWLGGRPRRRVDSPGQGGRSPISDTSANPDGLPSLAHPGFDHPARAHGQTDQARRKKSWPGQKPHGHGTDRLASSFLRISQYPIEVFTWGDRSPWPILRPTPTAAGTGCSATRSSPPGRPTAQPAGGRLEATATLPACARPPVNVAAW